MPLDPQVRRIVRALTLGGRPPADLSARRTAFAALLQLACGETDASGVTASEHAVPSGPALRLYTPAAAPAPGPGLVFLHGGGFVCGSLETHDALCRALAAASSCRLVAVEYRLAPEHVFPAAHEDAIAAWDWTLANARALGLDRARIGVVGESASASLAVAIARRGQTALQVLLCPLLDWTAAASRAAEDDFLVDRATIAQDLACCLPDGTDPADPLLSPLRARSVAGLPPALIHTAEYDPFAPDGAAYAARLQAAGIAARCTDHPGMVHLFHALGRAVPAARAAIGAIGAEIRTALGAGSGLERPAAPQLALQH